MRTSDNLFQLIKSMGKAEKGYFKKYSSLHTIGEKNNYVKLFDAIEKQAGSLEEYDEQLVKDSFDEKFIRQLPVVKNYLYSTILESLQLFNSGRNELSKLKDLVEQYDLLMERALHKQAGELLRKAKKTAAENEVFTELINILAREKIYYRETLEPAEFQIKFRQLYEEELETLNKMKNVADFTDMRSKLIEFISVLGSGFVRNEEEKNKLMEFLSHPLLESEDNAITKHTKRNFYQFRANLYLYLEELETSYQYQQKHLKITEESNLKFLPNSYLLTALNNVLTLQIRLKKYSDCNETLYKIKNFESIYDTALSANEKAFRVYSVIVTEIPLRMETREFELGLETVNVYGEQLVKYSSALNAGWRVVSYYLIASYSFVLADFEKSRVWLAKILQISSTDFYSDYQCYARIMNLIIHYELRNFDHIDYVMKSTYYFLRKRNKMYKYEQIIIKYMKRSLRANNEKALIELFREMKYELEIILKDNYEKNAFDAFNIIPWLESKIAGKSLRQILLEDMSL